MSIGATSGGRAHNATAATSSQIDPIALPGQGLMSPEEIMTYVATALNEIGGQMDTIRDKIKARQEKARDVRRAQELFNELTAGGDSTINENSPQYNELMQLLENFRDDPHLHGAYKTLVVTVGAYTDKNDN